MMLAIFGEGFYGSTAARLDGCLAAKVDLLKDSYSVQGLSDGYDAAGEPY